MPRINRKIVLLPLPLWPMITSRSCGCTLSVTPSSTFFSSNFMCTSRSSTISDEVLTSERMFELYRSHVDVVRVHGRIVVVGESTESGFNIEEPHHIPVAVEPH